MYPVFVKYIHKFVNPQNVSATDRTQLLIFRHCLFIRASTQAYLEKRLGADFYKVPRATAVRILSVVRESILWILKLFSERQPWEALSSPRVARESWGLSSSLQA